MAFNLPHPEMQPGEVWLCNLAAADYPKIDLATKRYGKIAYDEEGDRIGHLRPFFVQQHELEERGLPIPDPLGESTELSYIHTLKLPTHPEPTASPKPTSDKTGVSSPDAPEGDLELEVVRGPLPTHPEIQPGEVWMGNTHQKGLPNYDYKTRRIGEKAYDQNGHLIPHMFPVFVQKSEMRARGGTFPDQTDTAHRVIPFPRLSGRRTTGGDSS